MRTLIIFFFFAMAITAIFGFSGMHNNYPIFSEKVYIAPYEFSSFLFWIFMLLFLFTLVLGSIGKAPKNKINNKELQKEVNDEEKAISGGFILALFFVVISVISGLFGLGAIASTFAGLAMIIFWLSVILAIVALVMGAIERRPPPK